ncbi:hypothetical protein SDC9_128333 [bioreactor metagenome]|uniref:Uncharacterized protein n=1 Tax=bioreactor metagenome TaxID=1076179 RepID=A0A645CWJ3_9ZZZZ|nr:hypothetical protein [Clostridia bacterium]
MNTAQVTRPLHPQHFNVEESALLSICPDGSRTQRIAALKRLLPYSSTSKDPEMDRLLHKTLGKLESMTDETFQQAYILYDEPIGGRNHA